MLKIFSISFFSYLIFDIIPRHICQKNLHVSLSLRRIYIQRWVIDLSSIIETLLNLLNFKYFKNKARIIEVKQKFKDSFSDLI